MIDRRLWLAAFLVLAGCQAATQPPTAQVPPPAGSAPSGSGLVAASDSCHGGATTLTVAGDRGIGGTGINNGGDGVADRGIGGTGVSSAPGGIGGTGLGPNGGILRGLPKSERGGGGTGIFGVITGFRSICIDGLEVAADRPSYVTVDGVPRETETLRIGEVAEIEARGLATSLHATSIAVLHEVSGPVTAIDASGRAFDIAGQHVVLAGQSSVDAELRVGAWVQVSGLRDLDGAIRASRIDARAPGGVLVAGIPRRVDGKWLLGALTLDLPPGKEPDGGRVMVAGDYAGGTLRVTALTDDSVVASAAADRNLVVESYSSLVGGELRLGEGLEARVGPAFGPTPPADRPVVLEMTTEPNNSLTAVSWHEARSGNSGGGASAKAPNAVAVATPAATTSDASASDAVPTPAATTTPATTTSATPAASAGAGANSASSASAATGAGGQTGTPSGTTTQATGGKTTATGASGVGATTSGSAGQTAGSGGPSPAPSIPEGRPSQPTTVGNSAGRSSTTTGNTGGLASSGSTGTTGTGSGSGTNGTGSSTSSGTGTGGTGTAGTGDGSDGSSATSPGTTSPGTTTGGDRGRKSVKGHDGKSGATPAGNRGRA